MIAIIIEDEPLSAEHLTNMLKKIDPHIKVIAIIDTVKKCIEIFKKGIKADLLFVDIHLADGLSFSIFTEVAIEIPVIFTTAYNEYAINAFKVNSIDYLLKPIGLEELTTSINKFRKLNIQHYTKLLADIGQHNLAGNKQYKTRFMVKSGDTIVSVKINDVEHFISEDGLVLLATTTGKRFAVDYTLDELESLILMDDFFRINRKVLLNINAIKKVSSYFNSRLKINANNIDGDATIVSRERVTDFKHWLDK